MGRRSYMGVVIWLNAQYPRGRQKCAISPGGKKVRAKKYPTPGGVGYVRGGGQLGLDFLELIHAGFSCELDEIDAAGLRNFAAHFDPLEGRYVDVIGK